MQHFVQRVVSSLPEASVFLIILTTTVHIGGLG
jgi:hypothetical protein